MSSASNNASSKEPSIILSTRSLGFLATCLPTITIFVCIVSAFFTHEDKIAQYAIDQCIGVKIIIAPVSYSIATWRPQKQLWMLALIVHLPARTLLMIMYPQQWRERGWRWGFHFGTSLEILALVLLSLFHMASAGDFYVHFVSFGLWWMATIIVMVIVVHMQRGTMNVLQDPRIIAMRLSHTDLSLVALQNRANGFVYCWIMHDISLVPAFASLLLSPFTMFCIGEYTLITLNATFWTIVLIEFSREFGGFQIVAMRRSKMKEANIVSESSAPKENEIKHTLYDVDK